MLCAIAALYIANSQWNDAYHHLLEMTFTIGVPGFELSKSLHHWINDGLMALFFFVIGLELKREILVGELADPKQAILPIIAAVGGMLVPVLIYVSINPEGHALDGWGAVDSYVNKWCARDNRRHIARLYHSHAPEVRSKTFPVAR